MGQVNCKNCYYYQEIVSNKISYCKLTPAEFLEDNGGRKDSNYFRFYRLFTLTGMETGDYFKKRAKSNLGCDYFLANSIECR